LAVSPCPSLFPWAPFPVVFVAAVFVPLAVAHCAPRAVPLAPDVALAVHSAASLGGLQVVHSAPDELLAVHLVPCELPAVHSVVLLGGPQADC
jgi:hypothetical protein